ncbi:MAG: hypothetical protein GY929_01845 [Actinomycetia bacterium]|nr:hypothetical protein [Actinomycetes bacterium]
MANGESSARAALSRRRALQIGAGAAFAVPMVTSLAATPAYAQVGSFCPGTTTYNFDDFSQAQTPADGAGLDILPSNGSFVSDTRDMAFPQSVSGSMLTMIVPQYEAAITWTVFTTGDWGGVFDDCPSKMVLYGCTSIPESVFLQVSSDIGWLVSSAGVVMNGNELHFDVSDATTGNNSYGETWSSVEYIALFAQSTVQPWTDLVSTGPFLVHP